MHVNSSPGDQPVVIVGAGRHARNVVEILERAEPNTRIAGFLDDTRPVGGNVLGYPVLAGLAAMHDPEFVRGSAWIVAIGDNQARTELSRALSARGARFIRAVHPSAQVARSAQLGHGIYVGACATIASGATIGGWAIIEPHAHVGVDVAVGEGAFVGPGAILPGGASVGSLSFLGAAAVLSNDVHVGAGCVVGAHSLVLKPLADGVTAAGIPARPTDLRRRPMVR